MRSLHAAVAAGILGSLLGAGAVGCGEGAATGSEEIIGGASAKGLRLDAVGSLARAVPPPRDAGTTPSADASRADAPAADAGDDAEADAGPSAELPPAPYKPFCTATLVAPTLVVTAKHCVDSEYGGTLTDRETIFFNLGADGARPRRAVKAKRTWLAPLNEGGFVKLGVDVALVELEEAVDDVTPLPMLDGHLGESAVGARLSAVGFGYRDRARSIGQRRAGTLTLHATRDAFMPTVFPSVEALVAHVEAESPEAYDETYDRSRLETLYGSALLPDAEVFLGLGDGDSQPCSGDSGGPLLARFGDELAVVAVVSGSHKLSNRDANPCSVLGEIYATFGPVVQAMLAEVETTTVQSVKRVPLAAVHAGSEAALPPAPPRPEAGTSDAAGGASEGEEPSDEPRDGGAPGQGTALSAEEAAARCRGLTSEGTCRDGAVLRCIPQAEGPPRATRVDCTLLLSTCTQTADGVAECAD